MTTCERAGANHSGPVVNVHGRRGGRGLRAGLILVKTVSVSAFAGGLAAVLATGLLSPTDDPALARDHAKAVELLFTRLIVPGTIGALVSGTLLFLSVWSAMVRMRWFLVKLTLVAVGLPALHLFLRDRLTKYGVVLNENLPDWDQVETLRPQIVTGVEAALGLAGVLILLGRIKPRLWQDYGRTFARRPAPPHNRRHTDL